MKNCIWSAFLALSAISSASAGERLAVSDNSGELKIRDTIATLEKAFDSEDIAGYADCFKESSRKSVRRQTALLFAAESCLIDVEEVHIIEIGSEEAEVAVRYGLTASGGKAEVVSTVKFIREGDKWLVSGEKMVSKKVSSGSVVAASKKPDAQVEWDPYNPDPNRISPNLHGLVGDIGIRPGMGCADGKCANGRCER